MKNLKIVVIINVLCSIVFLVNTIMRFYISDVWGGIGFGIAAILFAISAILNYRNFKRTRD